MPSQCLPTAMINTTHTQPGYAYTHTTVATRFSPKQDKQAGTAFTPHSLSIQRNNTEQSTLFQSTVMRVMKIDAKNHRQLWRITVGQLLSELSARMNILPTHISRTPSPERCNFSIRTACRNGLRLRAPLGRMSRVSTRIKSCLLNKVFAPLMQSRIRNKRAREKRHSVHFAAQKTGDARSPPQVRFEELENVPPDTMLSLQIHR